MSLAIRNAAPDDCSTLVAFNQALARTTEGKDLDGERLARGVARVLADPIRGRYFVADWDGLPVGCLMVTREWSDWRDAWFWWIQSVFVADDVRRRGVYRALHQHVLHLARGAGDVCGLRLYVERDNRTAQATYKSLGMGPGSYELYEVDFGSETDSA